MHIYGQTFEQCFGNLKDEVVPNVLLLQKLKRFMFQHLHTDCHVVKQKYLF